MLNITNGQSANDLLAFVGIPGRFLGWDDPLHQGPVPSGMSLREMSRIRARFIAGNRWNTLDASQQRFENRDLQLHQAAKDGSVVIWSSFELFDQLQLLQLLAWFEQHNTVYKPPCVIWIRDYLGSGQLGSEELRALYEARKPLNAPQLGTAADIWEAFTAAEPNRLFAWYQRTLTGLPFMTRALRRLMEEYPSTDCGLSRTETQIVEVLDAGPISPAELFDTSQALESRRFMGDWSFWLELQRLIDADQVLVREARGERPRFPPSVDVDTREFRDQRFELTEFGREVLSGEQDFLLQWSGERWIGGVRIHADCPWRWDSHTEHLQAVSQ